MTKDFLDFIIEHENDDVNRLLLSAKKWPEIDVQMAADIIVSRKKVKSKLPSWYSIPGIIYPGTIPAQQCSSEETADYKAQLAHRIASFAESSKESPREVSSKISSEASKETQRESSYESSREASKNTLEKELKIADLTSGLGVDCAAFAKYFDQVLYNDMNPALFEAAKHNFPLLGISNIEFHNNKIEPNFGISTTSSNDYISDDYPSKNAPSGLNQSENFYDILKNFEPDLIFLDPARRDKSGGKVFKIEDCTPDILSILGALFSLSNNLVFKLSPMLDVNMAIKSFNEKIDNLKSSVPQIKNAKVREVHITSADGECKEVLFWLSNNINEVNYLNLSVKIIAISSDGSKLEFTQEEEKNAIPVLSKTSFLTYSKGLSKENPVSAVEHTEKAKEKDDNLYIFEPDKSITKAGAFNLLCERYGLIKIGISSHYYILAPQEQNKTVQDFRELSKLGKLRKVIEIQPLNKKTMKTIGKKYFHSEIKARNLKITTDALRKKMKLSSGNETQIYALKADYCEGKSENLFFVTLMR